MSAAYDAGAEISPLIFGLTLGLVISTIRVRNSRRAAEAAGAAFEPPRFGPWPIVGLCVGGLYVLSFLGGSLPSHSGTSRDHDALRAAMDRQNVFELHLKTAISRPPGQSYAELDSRLPAMQDLEREGSALVATLRGLDRSGYPSDQLEMIDALQGLVGAEVGLVNQWEGMVRGRTFPLAVDATAAAPGAASAYNHQIAVVARAAIRVLPPSVALKTMTQDQADSTRAQLEAKIAAAQALSCTC